MSQGSMQVKAAFQFHEPSLCVTARTLLMKSCSFLRQTVLNAEITGAGPSMFTHHNRYNIAQLPSQHFMHSLRLCPTDADRHAKLCADHNPVLGRVVSFHVST